VDVRQLFRVIDWLMDLPVELQDGFEDDVEAWEKEISMRVPYVSFFERRALENGLREGIVRVLKSKFKKVDKRLLAKIEAITEADNLRALMDAVLASKTLQEVREHLKSLQGTPAKSEA